MKLTVRETVIFGMLGALMYASKIIMEAAPNIHLIGVFVIAMTVVYRQKALYPIYTYALINGLLAGFSAWWVPYLYVWTVLWGVTMLLPRKMPKWIAPAVYSLACAFHGFLYGVIYAPAQALMFGLSWDGMIAWIIAGLPFDMIHGISNFFCGFLICPLIAILKYPERYTGRS